MVKTAEQKVRDRYLADLTAGKMPRALTDANRAILEEVRAEVEAGKARIWETADAVAGQTATRIHAAGQEAVSAIDAAKERALQEIASASSSSCQSAPVAKGHSTQQQPAESACSVVAPAAQETPLIQAVAHEALGFNEPGQEKEPEQEAESGTVALPQAFTPPVPEVSRAPARRPQKRPRDLSPANGALAIHSSMPSHEVEAKRRRELDAWVEQARRSAATKAELQEFALRREQDERNKQECRALALEEIDSKCRGCKQCIEMDYVTHGPDADLMCSKHAKQYEEIVNKKIRRGR